MVRGDTIRVDTTTADTTSNAAYLLPSLPRDNFYAVPVQRLVPSLLGGSIRARQQLIELDSSLLQYNVRETIGGKDIRTPVDLSLQEYLAAQQSVNIQDGFRSLAAGRLQRQQRRAGVGINIDIPGGNQSAFRTIFGKNEVDLRVTGNSTLDLGVGYDQNALDQSNQNGSLAPDFGQELNLNVAGTIGDKLRINVNYDTQSQFDFENQVSLVYTGYEDDIVQKVEAGNVFLQTPSELIRGGQRLFGLRADLQFGPLSVTGVASQQDAESDAVVIEGGSQATTISLSPTRYENDTHFFLGFAFYSWWNNAHQDPSVPTPPPGLGEITDIEVWVQDPQANSTTNSTDAIIFGVGLTDLGEPIQVLEGGRAYLDLLGGATAPLPSPEADQYDDQDLVRLRTQANAVLPEEEFGLTAGEFVRGKWRQLRPGTDFTLDERLGWISLTGALGPEDALAVTYQYRRTDGTSVTIGDFSNHSTDINQEGERSRLKLLRGRTTNVTEAPWDLTMRNIYRVGGRSINPSNFTLNITYEPPGNTAQFTLPGVQISDGINLLAAFGLDRTADGGVPRSDNEFDFRTGYTIDAQNGRIIFPVREPFGRYLEGLLRDGIYVDGQQLGIQINAGYDAVASDLVFKELYELKPAVAERQLNKLSRYNIGGEYKSASQSVFNVGFGVVEGSVTVTSGGTPLIEGQDYIVNETAGTVEIRNPLYLAPGKQIRVEVEKNKLFSIGSKTLVGLRSDYRISDNAGLGATWMRLAERPLNDKFRIGEEALENTIFGVDGGVTFEPRWITRALDALPLIQTRAPSSLEFRGEFAQFSPGHPETFAFRQVQRDLADLDRSLPEDEARGISSIDDFEQAETVNSTLEQAFGWRIAAPPKGSGPMDGAGTVPYVRGVTSINDPRLATNWRGLFGFYTVNNRAYETLADRLGSLPVAAQPVFPQDLYDRQFTDAERRQPLGLLDVYFDPTRRGPYNFNRELATTFASDNPSAWGGMIQSIDAAYSDFDGANTIESIEFLVAPLGGRDGVDAINQGAVLNFDLGILNEDTLPNGALNSEDGISESDPDRDEIDEWGRLADGNPQGNVDFYEDTGRTEDLGLDGLASRRDLVASGGVPYAFAERDLEGVAGFLAALPTSGPERLRSEDDPSGDDYHHFDDDYFDDNGFFPGRASAQERFSHFYSGSELNNNIPRDRILPDENSGNSRVPSTEDIDDSFTATRQSEEQFYRYSLPLDESGLRASPYFTGSTIETNGATWYLVRIPVRSEERIDFGGNLANVQMVRMWTTGHQQPATLRFATLELVGSQWQKSLDVGITEDGASGGTGPDLFIASINTDENTNEYLTPVSALRPINRDLSGSSRDARETSLVFRAEGLGEGQSRALFKPFSTNRLDLTKYSNVRMYVHGEGFETRDNMRIFLRLGADETENYYEIEQPIYPSDSEGLVRAFGNGEEIIDPTRAADYLWQTNACPGGDDPEGEDASTRVNCSDDERQDLNSINIVLSELNKIKVARDASGAPTDVRYTEDRTPEGAAPGARLSIVGTPSIQSVSNVVVGIRNGENGDPVPLEAVEVWLNELRVSGYDEGGGASGFLTAQARLADVVNATARVSLSQDGFGGLGAGLGDRDFVDRFGVTLSSTFNAHKLLPERYGWSAPVQLSYTENQSTPRFDPTNSDIRIEDLAEQTLANEDLPEPERRILADSIRSAAQTVSRQRTLRIPLSKTGSRSPWLKYTLDALNLSYTNATQEARSPRQLTSDSDNWRVDASYRLTVPKPKTVRPFWFTSGVPLLGSALEGVRLSWLPSSLSFSTNAGRTVAVSRERPRAVDIDEPELVNDFLYPRRVTHDFGHTRAFNMQYRLFPFLETTYGSNTTQSLDIAGVNERFTVLARDTSGYFGDAGRIEQFDISRDEARLPGSELWQRFGITRASQLDSLQILGGNTPQLTVLPWAEAVGDVLSGDRRLLTDRYDQTFTSNLRISTRNVKWLAWIQPQAIGLSSSYAWDFQPVTGFEDQTIAGVGSQLRLTTGLKLRPREFWRLFPFYRSIEDTDRKAKQASDARRRERDAERERRKTEREAARAAEDAARLAAEAAASGDAGADTADTPLAPEAPSSGLPVPTPPPSGLPEPVGSRRTENTVAPEAAGAPAAGAPAAGAPAAGAPAATPEADDEPRRPLVDLGGLGRRLFLAATGFEDVQVNYRGALGSTANGVVGDGFSLLAAATGDAPPLAYRLGLTRRLPIESRLSDPDVTLQLRDVLSNSHDFDGRTTLQLTQSLRVSLNGSAKWDANNVYPIDRTPEELIERDAIRTGSGQSTVFAIGSSYQTLVDRHLDRYREDTAGASGDEPVTSSVGSASGLAEDFNNTFAGGLGRFGPDGLFTIPVPSWEVSWTGLSRWPILERFTQQVTIQHGYFASSQTSYKSIAEGSVQNTTEVGGVTLIEPLSEVEPNAIVVNERFQPLVGVRVGWKGGLSTELTYNRSRVLTLQPLNASLTQKRVSDVQGNVTYSKSGFRLPFFSRLRNTIRFTLTASLTNDETQIRRVLDDIEDTLAGEETESPRSETFNRVSIWPRVGYQISNRVNMDVFFRYERSSSLVNSRIASYDGGVTLRISFSN